MAQRKSILDTIVGTFTATVSNVLSSEVATKHNVVIGDMYRYAHTGNLVIVFSTEQYATEFLQKMPSTTHSGKPQYHVIGDSRPKRVSIPAQVVEGKLVVTFVSADDANTFLRWFNHALCLEKVSDKQLKLVDPDLALWPKPEKSESKAESFKNYDLSLAIDYNAPPITAIPVFIGYDASHQVITLRFSTIKEMYDYSVRMRSLPSGLHSEQNSIMEFNDTSCTLFIPAEIDKHFVIAKFDQSRHAQEFFRWLKPNDPNILLNIEGKNIKFSDLKLAQPPVQHGKPYELHCTLNYHAPIPVVQKRFYAAIAQMPAESGLFSNVFFPFDLFKRIVLTTPYPLFLLSTLACVNKNFRQWCMNLYRDVLCHPGQELLIPLSIVASPNRRYEETYVQTQIYDRDAKGIPVLEQLRSLKHLSLTASLGDVFSRTATKITICPHKSQKDKFLLIIDTDVGPTELNNFPLFMQQKGIDYYVSEYNNENYPQKKGFIFYILADNLTFVNASIHKPEANSILGEVNENTIANQVSGLLGPAHAQRVDAYSLVKLCGLKLMLSFKGNAFAHNLQLNLAALTGDTTFTKAAALEKVLSFHQLTNEVGEPIQWVSTCSLTISGRSAIERFLQSCGFVDANIDNFLQKQNPVATTADNLSTTSSATAKTNINVP